MSRSRVNVTFYGSSTDDYSKDIQTLFECLFAVYDDVIVISGGYQGTMKNVAEKGKEIARRLNTNTAEEKIKKEIFVQGILFDGYKNDPSNSWENEPNIVSDSQISFNNIGNRVQAMIELADIVIVLPGRTGTLHEILQSVETIRYGMDYSKESENFRRLLVHSSWKKSIDDLYKNGNMSQSVYQHLLNNLFSFDNKKEKKKEQIIKKLKLITPIEEKPTKKDAASTHFSIKIFGTKTNEQLPNDHKLAKVIAEINHILYGDYFDSTKKNKVVGLDVALKEADKETGKLFRLDSVGSSKYFTTLNNFLNKYKSVIENDSRVNQWYQINNIKITDASELFYHDHKNNSSLNGNEDGTIQNWIEYLQKDNLGKHLYWMSVKHERYHISTYLVLDCLLSENLKNNVEKVVNQFLLEYMLVESAEEYIKIMLDSSFKSVISDIIKRNEAHHITSHVSNRSTLDKILERIGKSHVDLADAKLYHTVLDLLNRFNQYRDERSEYLTYITNFSSPSSAYIFQDVIRPFVENTLLMDNIAANENINYEKGTDSNLINNKLQLKVKWNTNGTQEDFYAEYFDSSNKKLYCSENLPYLRLKNDKLEYPYDSIAFNNYQKDIEVSLPGTLGKHALYSILENFIRNSAKHGGDVKNNRLDIVLLLSDENEDSITVMLTDNCSFVTQQKIKEFNDSIQTEILKRKDLGLIDMKVNACLLAGMELNDENCKKALIAELYENKLAYKFKIAKPKKAVFIGNFTKRKDKANGFYSFQTIEEYSKSDISKSFEFAILSDDLYEKQKNTIACELPARVLKYSEIENSKAENPEHLYEAWLKKLRGDDKNANVHLFFEQDNNISPTKEFKAEYQNHQNLKVYSNEDLSARLIIEHEKNTFFDRHGGLIGKFSKEKSFVSTNHSWILIDKNNPDFDYISRYDIENKANLLAYELEEAGLLKVLVIDERIAEQSVRTISDTDQAVKLREDQRIDFWKWKKQNTKFNLTLFDLAWAANVFLATHLNEEELKQKINKQTEHYLKVKFNNGAIELETNIPSHAAYRENQKWHDKKTDNEISNSQNETISIKPDVMIIHRTKLKELLTTNSNFVKELMNKNGELNLVVTTGSGTTHGIEGDYKILPFAILSKLILGKRINKLQLSKTLLALTKNKI